MTPVIPLPAPARLGIVGGGQLARYFLDAARSLGYRTAVLDPDSGSPAMPAADERVVGAFDDAGALDRLAACCDAITVEFESVPAGSIRRLARRCRVAPSAEAFAVLEDRIREKRFLRAIGLPTTFYGPVIAAEDLDRAGCYPGVLKLARQSCDGKGQFRVDDARQALSAWRDLGQRPALLERRVAIDAEIAVVLARSADGHIVSYPPAQNRVWNGVPVLSLAPAPIPVGAGIEADLSARRIAQCLDYVGVLSVEFFLCAGKLLVNEVSPRTHASGFLSVEACETSQFEQQVRALCGLPLGYTALRSPAAIAHVAGALLRGAEPDWSEILGDSGGTLHLYGKTQPRPRRRMGHVTVLAQSVEEAAARASGVLARLNGPDASFSRRAQLAIGSARWRTRGGAPGNRHS